MRIATTSIHRIRTCDAAPEAALGIPGIVMA
jgi:hypothetical protein